MLVSRKVLAWMQSLAKALMQQREKLPLYVLWQLAQGVAAVLQAALRPLAQGPMEGLRPEVLGLRVQLHLPWREQVLQASSQLDLVPLNTLADMQQVVR